MRYSSLLDKKIRPKIIKDAIKLFDDTGETALHSPYGAILCHILNHCVKSHTSFQLSYLAGGGYSAKRLDLCLTCHKIMSTGKLQDIDCGGDCTECMARAGDPDCINTMKAVNELDNM